MTAVLLFAAGLLAGVVGTAGGITSLISYPALLLAGLPALRATMVNTIAIVACWPGAALASRPELAGRGPWLLRWGTAAALGGAAGSALLLSTPPGVFGRIVPFLVGFGALALLLQPRITAWRSRRAAGGEPVSPAGPAQPGRPVAPSRPAVPSRPALSGGPALPGGVVALSVYNGYFGAGSGVMLLALMLLTAEERIERANALKNMLVGAGTIISAVLLAALTPVDWPAAVPLAAGLFAGSTLGPRVARRLPAPALRWAVAFTGLALAVDLWLSPA